MINRNIFNKIFGILHRIEDFIQIICNKVLFVFYTVSNPDRYGIEFIVDRLRRAGIVYYNNWYDCK